MAYTDELDAVIACEQRLRRQIAIRLGEETGIASDLNLTEEALAAADAAIAAWCAQGEEQQDLAAFRPIGPLQELLAEHRGIVERIEDMRDRRLG
ncbi:hypothetical protein [Bosea sp. TAF32]|uniref:hypothetical protein n=1 Tax=Bosea sp. TAF32 TaxID=3237482 RepID=UPI003F93595A